VLPSLLSEHYLKDIFNTDECGLFSNLLPDKTSSFQKMKTVLEAKGVKMILLCLLVTGNMDGCGKLPFLVTGKYSKHVKS
jgi:hypothetical protein